MNDDLTLDFKFGLETSWIRVLLERQHEFYLINAHRNLHCGRCSQKFARAVDPGPGPVAVVAVQLAFN